MTSIPTASRTPDNAEVIRITFDNLKHSLFTMLPGIVQAYDPTTQKADVKPLIKRALPTQDGKVVVEALDVIYGVPVRFPRGGEDGEAFMTFPVKKGTYGILEFCMFSMDAYLSGNGSDTDPGDFRTHDVSDCVLHLGVSPDAKAIPNVDPDKIVVGFTNGVEIALAPDKIYLGNRAASDAVALASKVDARCAAIETNLKTHVHPSAMGPTGAETPAVADGASTASEKLMAE